MYTFDLTDKFLSKKEKDLFSPCLENLKLDKNIWEVFACLFKAGTKHTIPLVLRVFSNNELSGAAIILKCKKTGRALFKNKIMAGFIDALNIPVHIWIKFGCCMDMMSNPGFVKNPAQTDEIHKAMTEFLRKNCFLTFINDYSSNRILFNEGAELPSLPHGLISCDGLNSIQDYIANFKNIRKKIKTFEKKGGEFIRIQNNLKPELIPSLKKCFISTANTSVFYLPYQDLYLNSAIITSSTSLENVYYFVALLNGEFIGYQAAIKSGNHLNALHGAFDRSLKTTFHAYDILFVKMTEFALENKLTAIDFGAVLNYTKQKMINNSIEMSYFIFSKYNFIKFMFRIFLRFTKIQGKEQLKFR